MSQQNKPNGKDILEILIKLLAEQENVEIKYELTNRKGN